MLAILKTKSEEEQLGLEGYSIDLQKRVIQLTRKRFIAEIDRLQAKVNKLDDRYDELEEIEMREEK